MAWFTYKCEEHGNFQISLPKREKVQKCPNCGSDSRVVIKGGSIQIVERLDNGAMARRVERLNNVEEIMEERSRKHSEMVRKKMGIKDEE